MEYADGKSFVARLGRGPLPPPEVVTVGLQLADVGCSA
jgi:hypothetical protein